MATTRSSYQTIPTANSPPAITPGSAASRCAAGAASGDAGSAVPLLEGALKFARPDTIAPYRVGSLPPAISKTRFSKHGPAARIGYIDLGMILDDASIEVFTQGRELRPAHSWAHVGSACAAYSQSATVDPNRRPSRMERRFGLGSILGDKGGFSRQPTLSQSLLVDREWKSFSCHSLRRATRNSTAR